ATRSERDLHPSRLRGGVEPDDAVMGLPLPRVRLRLRRRSAARSGDATPRGPRARRGARPRVRPSAADAVTAPASRWRLLKGEQRTQALLRADDVLPEVAALLDPLVPGEHRPVR